MILEMVLRNPVSAIQKINYVNVTITYRMAKGKRKGKYDKAREKASRFYFNKWRGNEKITLLSDERYKLQDLDGTI